LGEQEELTAISSSRRAANKGTAPLSLPGFRAKNRFLQQQDIVEREREREKRDAANKRAGGRRDATAAREEEQEEEWKGRRSHHV
jgi:hypothetical protein